MHSDAKKHVVSQVSILSLPYGRRMYQRLTLQFLLTGKMDLAVVKIRLTKDLSLMQNSRGAEERAPQIQKYIASMSNW